MSAGHLRLVPDDGQTPAQAAYTAVQLLTQRYVLELFDALAELTAAHENPTAAARDLQQLRRNAVHVTGYVFGNVQDHFERRRCAQ